MNNPQSTITRTILIVVGIGIAIFIISRILPYIQGPQLSEINIEKQQLSDEYWYVIEGKTRNTEMVTINTINAPLAEDGSFTHPFALNAGRNELSITLSNGFKTTKELTYDIITPTSEELYNSVYNEVMEEKTNLETEELLEEPSDEQTTAIDNT